jgi:hypothetical protein
MKFGNDLLTSAEIFGARLGHDDSRLAKDEGLHHYILCMHNDQLLYGSMHAQGLFMVISIFGLRFVHPSAKEPDYEYPRL